MEIKETASLFSSSRLEGESYKDYRSRMALTKRLVKIYKRYGPVIAGQMLNVLNDDRNRNTESTGNN